MAKSNIMNCYKEFMVKGNEGLVLVKKEDKYPEPNYIKIKSAISLVSPGTENYYINKCIKNQTELPLGYCSSGVVEAIGENVIGFNEGDRVLAMGWKKAIHAQKIFVPQNLCVRIPDSLAYEDAVFANIAATAMHAIHRAEIIEQDKVLVIGGGLVGQLVALYSKLISHSVLLTDLKKERIEIADRGGVATVSAKQWEGVLINNKPTKMFVCISGVADKLFESLFQVINTYGNGFHRSKIIGVGRFTAKIDFSVAMGNIDIVYSARCGEGYRDLDYETGRKEVFPVSGEQNVKQNLEFCLKQIDKGTVNVDHLKCKKVPFDDILDSYKDIKDVIGMLIEYN
jgi:threonine dehydrogenase-like Zn-dependent dehydrogenase